MSETAEPNVAIAPPAPKPSRAIRVLWWCDLLMPLGGVLIFLLPGLFIIAAVAAFIVVVDSVTDRHLTPQQRLIGLSLSVGPILAGLLAIYIAGSIMYFDDERGTVVVLILALAAVAAWVVYLFWVKPRAWQITKKVEWKS